MGAGSGIYTLMLTLAVASHPRPGIENKPDASKKPSSLTLAIAKADQLLSRVLLDRWSDEPNDQIRAALSTIVDSGVFRKPQKMTLTVRTAFTQENAIVVKGTFQARRKKLYDYRAEHEKDEFRLMDNEEKSQRKRHNEALHDLEDHYKAGHHFIIQLLRKQDRERDRLEDEHRNAKKDLNHIAKERQIEYERIPVDVLIPDGLAGDVTKIAQARRLSVTILVDYVALRPPMLEVGKPMAIGLVRGTATKIPDRLRH